MAGAMTIIVIFNSSTLKMEASRFSKTLVNSYQNTWCYTQKVLLFIYD